MKKNLVKFALALLVSLASTQIYAQFWAPFIPLLEQWSTDELAQLGSQTEDTYDDFSPRDFDLNSANDGLRDNILNADLSGPFGTIPRNWGPCRDVLEDILKKGGFSLRDLNVTLRQFDNINHIWNEHAGTFDVLLDENRNNLQFDPDIINEGVGQSQDMSGEWEEAWDEHLLGTTMDLHERYALGKPHGSEMERVLDNLFSTAFDLEMAFGREWGNFNYYWLDEFNFDATVFRVGNVPRFDRDWESRWHLQVSFLSPTTAVSSEGQRPRESEEPLMYNAECAFMYNPPICKLAKGSVGFRLYSSLGVEMRTYVPSHADALRPYTNNNVGNTTGMGPQIGAGFVLGAGPLVLYSYGTLSNGNVFNSPGYHYSSSTVNAGLRLGKYLNVLFTEGTANWAPNNAKEVKFSRFSIGLILSDLVR